jgi:hypothetical protein
MRRLLLLVPWVMLIAGCDAIGTGGPTPLPTPHVTVAFPPGSVVNVIKIDVLDNLPLRAAELVAPDGAVTPASWLNVNRKIEANGGQAAIASPWQTSAAFGDSAPTIFGNGQIDSARFFTHDELLLMSADADITLPDPVAYRRDWQKYHVRLTFGAPGGPDIRDIPAPQPPPG